MVILYVSKYQTQITRESIILSVRTAHACEVTSQGERVPQSMEIQHPQANIKGDMSNFMKNSENFISI